MESIYLILDFFLALLFRVPTKQSLPQNIIGQWGLSGATNGGVVALMIPLLLLPLQ
jgi:hypothetical protein